jgi:hypothetical protein
MDDARGAREKSGISAKRSGAAMYSAFECGREMKHWETIPAR